MLSSVISGIASALISAIAKLAALVGIYRAGEAAQAGADASATTKQDAEAATDRSTVAGYTHQQLVDELRKPSSGQ